MTLSARQPRARSLALALAVVATTACGEAEEDRRRRPATESPSAPGETDTADGGERPARPGDPRSPATSSDAATSVPFTGRYSLRRVGGVDLPATTDRGRPGCELQIVSGDLFITDGGARFRFTDAVREVCDGETRSRASYGVEGGVRREGDRITLAAEDPDPEDWATARGRWDPVAGEITLTRITGEAGGRNVQWRFTRTHGTGG